MNVVEEKKYLYEAMNILLDERRKITEELMEIRKRLNRLTEYQELGVSDIPTADYFKIRAISQQMQDANRDLNIPSPIIDNFKESSIIIEENKNNNITAEHNVHKSTATVKKARPSYEKVRTVVVNALKENEEPLSLKKLKEIVTEKLEYDYFQVKNSLNTFLWRLKKSDSRLISAGHGLYTIKN